MRRGPFRGFPREVPVLVAVAFAVAIGFGIVSPAIPVFARRFGVSHTAAASVVSAFAFTRLATAPLCGRLIERFGERGVLATGIGVVAVSSLLAGLAQSYVELVVLRGAGGFGSAMFSISATTLLLRSVDSARRGRASGMLAGGFLLGGISGPALGGFITRISIRAPFFIYAGTLVVAGTIAATALRAPAESADGPVRTEPVTSVLHALRSRAYRAALAANLADGWAVLGVRSALIPLFVGDVLHRSTLWTGIGFTVVAGVNALVLLPAGRLADRRGRRPVLIAGCSLSGSAMVLLAVTPDLAGYLGAMVVLGLGSGLLDVAPAAVVGDLLGGRGGRVVAAYQMAGDTGAVTGPVVGGRLADTVGYTAAFGVTAGILAAAAGLAVLAEETGGERAAAGRAAAGEPTIAR